MLKQTKILFFIGAIFVCLYIIGFALFTFSLPNKSQPLSVENTDGIVVFTGGSKRIEAVVRLLAEGYENPVLISGVNPKVTKEKLIGHLPLKDQLLVTLDYDSLSTKENVLATDMWAKVHKMKSIGLITSFYHMPRSLLYWQRQSTQAHLKPYPVFPDNMPISFMFREYHKYILTALYII